MSNQTNQTEHEENPTNPKWLNLIEHDLAYTALSTKVVPQKRKSVRDNDDRYNGKKEFGVD